MTGTAELIARAIAELEGCGCRICTLARDALAAQAQEIERLTERNGELGNIQRNSFLSLKANGEKIAELVLRHDAQAQEIERLKTALMAARNRIEDDAQTIDRHVAKIGKLQNALIGRDG